MFAVVDADPTLVLGAFEDDLTVDEGEEGVVVADTDIGAGVELGAALSDDDHARFDDLTAEPFDAQTLGVTVATVFGRTLTFLMCHSVYLPPTTSFTWR